MSLAVSVRTRTSSIRGTFSRRAKPSRGAWIALYEKYNLLTLGTYSPLPGAGLFFLRSSCECCSTPLANHQAGIPPKAIFGIQW